MQTAKALLEIINERGKKGLPLERLYRHLFNPELYLRAYGKIYRNDGAMTPGVNAETVDGMSLKKIQAVIQSRHQRPPDTETQPAQDTTELADLGSIRRRPVVTGMISEYHRAA